jgi:pimeloyl-ACP methyl ester carboxylesterase
VSELASEPINTAAQRTRPTSVSESPGVRRSDVRIDVPGGHAVATRIVLPDPLPADGPVAVLCCVPGGGTTGAYFDLVVPGNDGAGDDSYSFAAFAARRGFAVVTVDNLGTGGSGRPDVMRLLPATVAEANSVAFAAAVAGLRAGGHPPVTIGVGHSMGGMLTILAQAADRAHAAIAPLGFTTSGLPEILAPRERLLVGAPGRFTDELADVAAERAARPRVEVLREAPDFRFPFHLDDSPAPALRALAAVTTNLLPAPGLLSMLPGNVAEAAARIRVPVFLGVGDHEHWHEAAELAAQYPASPDVTVYVLRRAAHNHTVAPTRLELYRRLTHWAEGVAEAAARATPAPNPPTTNGVTPPASEER